MTLEELKTECQTQGYQPNRATVLKLLEIIAVLREGLRTIQASPHLDSVDYEYVTAALDKTTELERSL